MEETGTGGRNPVIIRKFWHRIQSLRKEVERKRRKALLEKRKFLRHQHNLIRRGKARWFGISPQQIEAYLENRKSAKRDDKKSGYREIKEIAYDTLRYLKHLKIILFHMHTNIDLVKSKKMELLIEAGKTKEEKRRVRMLERIERQSKALIDEFTKYLRFWEYAYRHNRFIRPGMVRLFIGDTIKYRKKSVSGMISYFIHGEEEFDKAVLEDLEFLEKELFVDYAKAI